MVNIMYKCTVQVHVLKKLMFLYLWKHRYMYVHIYWKSCFHFWKKVKWLSVERWRMDLNECKHLVIQIIGIEKVACVKIYCLIFLPNATCRFNCWGCPTSSSSSRTNSSLWRMTQIPVYSLTTSGNATASRISNTTH